MEAVVPQYVPENKLCPRFLVVTMVTMGHATSLRDNITLTFGKGTFRSSINEENPFLHIGLLE